MRTLAEALAGAVRGGHVELGDEELVGSTVRVPAGLSIAGGVIHGEAQVMSPVGLLWEGPRFPDHPVNTAGMLTVLGGSDWVVSRADITGGQSYGQIRVSLDLTQTDPAKRVPMRWMVEGCRAGPAGSAYVYPQNDSIYILGTPGVAMGGLVRNCTFGPAPKGVPIKVGGELKGVLAVQPEAPEDGLLEERAQFVEMVANLIGQSLRLSMQVAQEKSSLLEERDLLRRTVRHQFGFDSMVGRSAVMRRVFDQARMVAKWNTTVLIRGETGTGKELIANAIHYNSPRARNALVKLNCAALPENLLESELFGHERGAFTGATTNKKGLLETAHGGVLFLDELPEFRRDALEAAAAVLMTLRELFHNLPDSPA